MTVFIWFLNSIIFFNIFFILFFQFCKEIFIGKDRFIFSQPFILFSFTFHWNCKFLHIKSTVWASFNFSMHAIFYFFLDQQVNVPYLPIQLLGRVAKRWCIRIMVNLIRMQQHGFRITGVVLLFLQLFYFVLCLLKNIKMIHWGRAPLVQGHMIFLHLIRDHDKLFRACLSLPPHAQVLLLQQKDIKLHQMLFSKDNILKNKNKIKDLWNRISMWVLFIIRYIVRAVPTYCTT